MTARLDAERTWGRHPDTTPLATRFERSRTASTPRNAANGGCDADGGGDGGERDTSASTSVGDGVPSGDAAERGSDGGEPVAPRVSSGGRVVSPAGVGLWYVPVQAFESGHFRLGWALVAGLALLALFLVIRYRYAR